jgi:hypothetical protein
MALSRARPASADMMRIFANEQGGDKGKMRYGEYKWMGGGHIVATHAFQFAQHPGGSA